jgi:hypothetical protein
VLIGFLIQAVNPPYANAAVKPGTICQKLGQTSVSAGFKYTCVKSGKKLIWNKGVAIKSASTPSTSPRPSSSPSIKNTDAFAVYGKDADRFRAVDAYGAILARSRKVDAPTIVKILQSPGDESVIRMTANAQFAYSLYEQLMPLGFIPKWIVGEKGDWVKGEIKDICPNLDFLMPNQGAASCRLTVVWRGIAERDDSIMRNTMLVQGGHEIFHLYQQELWGQYWKNVPDWLREGSASVGMGIVLTHFEDRRSFANYGAAQLVEKSPKDRATCEASLTKWEKNLSSEGFGFNNGCEYGLGLLMNEYLIMKGYTLKDSLDVVKLIGTGVDFPIAFQQVYKLSTQDFFRDLRGYLQTLEYGW